MKIGQQGERPAKPAVHVSLTDADYEAVAHLSHADGMSMAAYVRRLVRRQIVQEGAVAA